MLMCIYSYSWGASAISQLNGYDVSGTAGAPVCVANCCDNGLIKVCIDPTNFGGAISYLGVSGGSNLVDQDDVGRLVQPAFYYSTINPEPGGSQATPATVTSNTDNGTSIHFVTTMANWNSPYGATSEILTTTITPIAGLPAVKVDYHYPYTGGVNYGIVHSGTGWCSTTPCCDYSQEAMALYLSTAQTKIAYYDGASPWTGAGIVNTANTGLCGVGGPYYTVPSTASENWAAIIDSSDFGGGVYFPAVYNPVTNNFAMACINPAGAATGKLEVHMDSNMDIGAKLDWTEYIAVGSITAIRSAFTTIHSGLDVTAPTITAFTPDATSASLTVPVTFTATDATGVTGYIITESSTKPVASNPAWVTSAPTSYVATYSGPKTLYGWARDAAGNVSSSSNGATTITLSKTYVGYQAGATESNGWDGTTAWNYNYTYTTPSDRTMVTEISANIKKASGTPTMRCEVVSPGLSTKYCEGTSAVSLSSATGAWEGHMTASAISPNPCVIPPSTPVIAACSFHGAGSDVSVFINSGHTSGDFGYNVTDYTTGFPGSPPYLPTRTNSTGWYDLRVGFQ